MRSVKGPRSALTDFIEESGIKLQNRREGPSERASAEPVRSTKKPKQMKRSKPIEIVNHDAAKTSKEDKRVMEMLENIDSFAPDDELLRQVAEFLSRNRMMDQHYFDLLVRSAGQSLCVFDCSRIRDCGFAVCKSLKRLELFQCGQLSEATLNCMLRCMPEIEVLRLTGGYLIENFEIPRTLRVLDVANCSRLRDEFISNINATFERLSELRLSYCYGLSSSAMLTIEVDRLFICETRLSERFLESIGNARSLSVKRCPNVNALPPLKSIEYLDADGIVTLKQITVPETIRHLNVSHCVQLDSFVYPGLEYLDISYMNLSQEDLRKVLQCQKLKYLNISWISSVDDVVLEMMVNSLRLEKLVVFGCFGLTESSARLAYSIRDRCEVIGNPSETLYLLKNH